VEVFKKFLAGLFIFAIFNTAWADEIRLPASITRFIPNGLEVLSYAIGQLTNDGRQDYLVVAHHPVDTVDQPSIRPLFIFTQNANKTFKLAARNDFVVMRANDGGGQCDPFTDAGDNGLVIRNHYFTVQNSESCGKQHWTDFITFHYDAKRRNWLFHSHIVHSFHLNQNAESSDDEPALLPNPTYVEKADINHPVTFDAWRPR
jgi:hypothetical protein